MWARKWGTHWRHDKLEAQMANGKQLDTTIMVPQGCIVVKPCNGAVYC
jgi:hypothetical protein